MLMLELRCMGALTQCALLLSLLLLLVLLLVLRQWLCISCGVLLVVLLRVDPARGQGPSALATCLH